MSHQTEGETKNQVPDEYAHLPRRKDQFGRLVPEKTANKPYFAHQDWKAKQKMLQQEKQERQKLRAEKIARGEDPGADPDASTTAPASLLKTLVVILLAVAYAGYFVTGDFQWGYRTRWTTLKHWKSFLPAYDQTAFTESQLAKYDGTDASKPILLALDGIVYDVTAGRRTYGPGGSYHQFAGKDAARAYVTGCFATHLTHDIRGFTEKDMASLDHWRKFYADHAKYYKVGTVYHKPIDPSTPIPPDCRESTPDENSKAQPDVPPAAHGNRPAAATKPKKEL